MGKTAVIFPGQAAQYVGMGKDLYGRYDSVRTLFDRASSAAGFDMAALCFESPLESLTRTPKTQPAVLTHSIAVYDLIKDRINPDYLAGHSLGEWTAAVAAGSLEFEKAVQLLKYRGQCMEDAVREVDWRMVAVIGPDRSEVDRITSEISPELGVAQAANYNSPDQVTVSGNRAAVDEACRQLDGSARRIVDLSVGAPFHCTLMEPARQRMRKALADVEFADARLPIYSNVDAYPYLASSDIRQKLVDQISSPVQWQALIESMMAGGVDSFYELGPGKILSVFVKKIAKSAGKEVNMRNIDTLADVEAFLTANP